MADSIPSLPAEISPDGHEIWDWAHAMSARTQLVSKFKETREALAYCHRCGACSRWMTRRCPREVHDNKIGRTRGPSMKAIPCDQFNETPQVAARRQELRRSLDELDARLSSPSPQVYRGGGQTNV